MTVEWGAVIKRHFSWKTMSGKYSFQLGNDCWCSGLFNYFNFRKLQITVYDDKYRFPVGKGPQKSLCKCVHGDDSVSVIQSGVGGFARPVT